MAEKKPKKMQKEQKKASEALSHEATSTCRMASMVGPSKSREEEVPPVEQSGPPKGEEVLGEGSKGALVKMSTPW